MSQEWKDPTAGEDVQMPLGTGGDGGAVEEYAPPKVRVNTSTLALIASFLAALAVLYFMGVQNKPRPASAIDRTRTDEINKRVEDFLGNKDGRANVKRTSERLLEKLQEHLGGTMAAPAEPTGNPFAEDVVVVAKPPDPGPEQIVVVATQKAPPEFEDPALKEVAKDYAGLKLQLVMLGSMPSAMINNQMATVGTRFGHLAVAEIQNDRVLLSYEGPTGKKLVLPLHLNGSSADPNGVFGGGKPK